MRARRLGVGQEDECRRELLALAREHREVEIVERDDESDVVLVTQRGERRDVAGLGDPRHDRVRSQW